MALSGGEQKRVDLTAHRASQGLLESIETYRSQRTTRTSDKTDKPDATYTLNDSLIIFSQQFSTESTWSSLVGGVIRYFCNHTQEVAESSDITPASTTGEGMQILRSSTNGRDLKRREWTLQEISMLPVDEMQKALELLNLGTPAAKNRVDEIMKKHLT